MLAASRAARWLHGSSICASARMGSLASITASRALLAIPIHRNTHRTRKCRRATRRARRSAAARRRRFGAAPFFEGSECCSLRHSLCGHDRAELADGTDRGVAEAHGAIQRVENAHVSEGNGPQRNGRVLACYSSVGAVATALVQDSTVLWHNSRYCSSSTNPVIDPGGSAVVPPMSSSSNLIACTLATSSCFCI